MRQTPARTWLMAVALKQSKAPWTADESLDELAELARTAGLDVVGSTQQSREAFDSKFYLGEGKINELMEFIKSDRIEVVIADDELSPTQQKELEKKLGVKILDRTALVLAIFAARAMTYEAKLQVELAQLEYLYPRLTRMWQHLSRLGGGIGTRGPGETQLEIDKRRIQTRISLLKDDLEKVVQHRNTTRKKRGDLPMLTATLVGYTNSGKSTLMNRLTQAGVTAEDKLFATLDPTTRRMQLQSGENLLVSDTVGFIQKLPHQLVDAFRSTLEEAVYANVLLHVVDISHPKFHEMISVSRTLLADLHILNKPTLFVLNKADKLSHDEIIQRTHGFSADDCVVISAIEDANFAELSEKISKKLSQFRKTYQFQIPFNRMDIVSTLHLHGHISEEKFSENGVEITVQIATALGEKIQHQLLQLGKS